MVKGDARSIMPDVDVVPEAKEVREAEGVAVDVAKVRNQIAQ